MIDPILSDLFSRMDAAEHRYGAFASPHEALGVALEEWHEFIDAIRANDDAAAVYEAVDLAAVLIRFAMQAQEKRLTRRQMAL
jgi:hypothetical protein